jgi:hypothetical protein
MLLKILEFPGSILLMEEDLAKMVKETPHNQVDCSCMIQSIDGKP